jgi:catechol 2,3-dioxygenase-like lactoylglutathione lyase family enzyme
MLRDVATQAGPLVSGLSHVILLTRDMARSRAFYRDVLGVPLEGDDEWAEASLGNVRFALHRWFDGGGAPRPSSGSIHVNFEVGAFDEAVDRLRAAGVHVDETMRGEWGTAGFLLDPDGYRVYLYERPA